ncbi:hypothetical protein MRX96_005114 [Rhipicephalus microplus]
MPRRLWAKRSPLARAAAAAGSVGVPRHGHDVRACHGRAWTPYSIGEHVSRAKGRRRRTTVKRARLEHAFFCLEAVDL